MYLITLHIGISPVCWGPYKLIYKLVIHSPNMVNVICCLDPHRTGFRKQEAAMLEFRWHNTTLLYGLNTFRVIYCLSCDTSQIRLPHNQFKKGKHIVLKQSYLKC